MKAFKTFLFALLSPFLAKASFSGIKTCLQKNYQTLSAYRSIAVAVVDKDQTQILLFGKARENQIFEIGSITKTFTGTLLAQEVVEGSLRLNDPIPAVNQKSGYQITYLHLTTHTSGIIGGNFPDFKSPNPESPYEGLTIPLFQYLYKKTDLISLPGEKFKYSNIAVGLLGQILGQKNKTSYENLVAEKILRPLGMKDTYFVVPSSENDRFPQGNVNGKPFPYWHLAGTGVSAAGSIRSTIRDMAIYARANLAPERTSLAGSLRAAQAPLYKYTDRLFIAMNWMVMPHDQLIWHNGSTIGFNSMLALSSKYKVGVVTLTDTSIFKGSVQDKSYENIVFNCLK